MNNKYNNIDELLKESLTDYGKKPSTGVWQKITFRLWLLEKGIYFLIPIIIAVFIVGYFLFNQSESPTKPISPSYSETTETKSNDNQESAFESNTQNSPNGNLYNSNIEQTIQHKDKEVKQLQKSNQEQQIEEQVNTTNKTATAEEITIGKTSENTSAKNNNFIASSYQNQTNSQNIYPGLDELEKAQALNVNAFLLATNSNHNPQHIQLRSSVNYLMSDNKPKRTPLGYWSYGVHLVPEIIFTNNEDKDKKQSVSLDLTGIYSIKNVYFQFGAGIGLSNDKGKFNIDYSQYDSIGYYYAVTGFSINQQTGQPVYKTELENVYDTVYYNQTENADNLFTYLRIPAYVGVNVHNSKKVNLSIKAGGIYSILINSRESNYTFTNDNATWINVVDETHKRVSSNLQLSVGIGAALRLKENLSLSFEPAYNYYINNIYINDVSKKTPWSISLRTGIIFKL